MAGDSAADELTTQTSRKSRTGKAVEPEQNGPISQTRAITQQSLAPHPFAHPSEAEFAKILDFYGVRWEYEPRSFHLRWEGDRVVEMFTPRFLSN